MVRAKVLRQRIASWVLRNISYIRTSEHKLLGSGHEQNGSYGQIREWGGFDLETRR